MNALAEIETGLFLADLSLNSKIIARLSISIKAFLYCLFIIIFLIYSKRLFKQNILNIYLGKEYMKINN